jgi:PKD repeat protein
MKKYLNLVLLAAVLVIPFMLSVSDYAQADVTADFEADVRYGVAPLTVNFTDLSKNSSGNPLVWWNWSFGDGTILEGASSEEFQHPTHIYDEPGVYKVALYTTDGSTEDTRVKEYYIVVTEEAVEPEIFVDFEGDVLTGEAPLTVNFTDLTTKTFPNPQVYWNWKFGDGGSSHDQNPVHTYFTPGIYAVSLYTHDTFVEDTVVKEAYIIVESTPLNFLIKKAVVFDYGKVGKDHIHIKATNVEVSSLTYEDLQGSDVTVTLKSRNMEDNFIPFYVKTVAGNSFEQRGREVEKFILKVGKFRCKIVPSKGFVKVKDGKLTLDPIYSNEIEVDVIIGDTLYSSSDSFVVKEKKNYTKYKVVNKMK